MTASSTAVCSSIQHIHIRTSSAACRSVAEPHHVEVQVVCSDRWREGEVGNTHSREKRTTLLQGVQLLSCKAAGNAEAAAAAAAGAAKTNL